MRVLRVNKNSAGVRQSAASVRFFALAISLVLSLVLSQSVGFMHGVVHTTSHAHERSAQTVTIAHAAWAIDLFAGHGDESTCQVFDQLSHGSAMLRDTLAFVPLSFSRFFLDSYQATPPAYQRSLVQARGPPVSTVSAVV